MPRRLHGELVTDELGARLAEYARLRDSGMRQWDAAREMGAAPATCKRYERWYRQQRGMESRPTRNPDMPRLDSP